MNVYSFQGNEGEEVPETVEKLIVEEGVQELPDRLCYRNYPHLQEVSLPNGLIEIGIDVFSHCENLLEIRIRNTVKLIEKRAFMNCDLLTKVTFECSTTSPHQLRLIGAGAFRHCSQLSRIKLPSSVQGFGHFALAQCFALIEANLSTTGVTIIFPEAFYCCSSLQTVSLPNTVRYFGNYAFCECSELVTLVVPFDSQSIQICHQSFHNCRRLANFSLPNDSTAHGESFTGCELLHERYGEDNARIVAGLMGRYEHFAIHRICYDHSKITVQKLLQCIKDQQEGGSLLVDEFGMNPFHVFFLTPEPSMELLQVLLDSLPNQILNWKDANGKRPLEYLINNCTDETKSLLHRTLQAAMIDQISQWGTTLWIETIQSKVQALLAEENRERRTTLCNEAYSLFEHYENVQVTSILEMALWKSKLKSGWTNDGTKRQALDREECRLLSGSDVVIPCIATMLGIPQTSD